jgi:hypothetical protein
MKLAYADPPYPGQAKAKYADHPDYDGEVDHAELIARLEDEYDGWALSTSEQALQEVLALCPTKDAGIKGRRYRSGTGVRIIIWCKQAGQPFPNEGIHGFEPVIVRGARPPATNLRDWIVCEPEYFQWRPKPADYVTGQKPAPVAEWIFRWLGAEHDDDLDDIFPGSGNVGTTWRRYTAQAALL